MQLTVTKGGGHPPGYAPEVVGLKICKWFGYLVSDLGR